MSQFSLNQEIAVSVASATSGTLSCAASSTIIIMIYRSPTQLGNPFRRILFGMSIYDVFQSTSAILSLFLSPAGERWGAFGNQSTCTFSGLIFQVRQKKEHGIGNNYRMSFDSLVVSQSHFLQHSSELQVHHCIASFQLSSTFVQSNKVLAMKTSDRNTKLFFISQSTSWYCSHLCTLQALDI